MQDEILDELNRVANDFWYEKKVLDHHRIREIRSLRVHKFGEEFDSALKNFLKIRRIIIDDRDPAIDELLGIDPAEDFARVCDKFLEVVTTAKDNDVIIDKKIVKELDECKEKCSNLESKLREQEFKIKELDREVTDLRAENIILKRDSPNSNTFTSDVTDD